MTTPDLSASSIAPERSPVLPPDAVTERTIPVPSSTTGLQVAPFPGLPGDNPHRPYRGLDNGLSGVVWPSASLAASFVAINHDLWLHLASGRLLARGEYRFGIDPFAYTTEGVYWANSSWLYDWLLYGLHRAIGGPGLVLLKALLVAGLAWALLGVRRWSGDVGVPAACTALAILAMSPRLFLQPAVLSCVFLGLTLWLLWRHRPPCATAVSAVEPPPRLTQPWHFAPLLLLFALWANLDEWFFLGPAVVTLVWLGQLLQRLLPADSGGKGEKGASVSSAPRLLGSSAPPLPVWLVPASWAVCLLNPHHFHVFALPAELSPMLSAVGLPQDARFQGLFAPAWRLNLRVRPVAAINLAEWSYVILLALGLGSFLLNWRHLSGGRLLVWIAFAGLSIWRVRTVPFFAVVAGPITALELQNFLARRRATQPARREGKRLVTGRVALLTAGLALLVLTWAGWLQGFYREERRPAWAVQAAPPLRHVAQTIQRLRDEGKLTANDRVFPFHPDVGNYLAWFCPGEKVFLDGRLTLFGRVLPEYLMVCRQLAPDVDQRQLQGQRLVDISTEWRTVFRDQGITYLILHDPDPQLFPGTIKRFAER